MPDPAVGGGRGHGHGHGAEWIFVSYRRAETGGYAQSLYRDLKSRYGEKKVFFDAEKIDIGVDFPQRLEDAVKAARVVLVVIGPDWLKTVNERAAGEKVDYVRREIALALTRRGQGEVPMVQPVLVGGAAMPDEQDLAEALRAELGALTRLNAHPMHPVPRWEDDLKLLFGRIDSVRPRPDGPQSPAAIVEALRLEAAQLLARPEMKAIRDVWNADPLKDRGPGEAVDLLVELHAALEDADTAWVQSGAPPAPAQLQLVKEHCCGLVTLLYRLAVDIEAVHAWPSDSPVAVEQPGTAAIVCTATERPKAQVRASLRSEGSTFHAERTLDFPTGIDAGIGGDRLNHAFRQFWADTFNTEAPSSPKGVSDDDLRKLRNRMTFLAGGRGGPFGITEAVDSEDARASLRSLADRLGVRAYPRTGKEGSLLADEGLLTAGLCVCIEKIKRLGSTE